MFAEFLIATLISFPAQVKAETPTLWMPETLQGKRAFSEGRYADSAAAYRAAIVKAEEANAPSDALLPLLEALAASLKVAGNPAQAQSVVERMLSIIAGSFGSMGAEYASGLSELADVQRLQDLREEASKSIAKAVEIRSSLGLSEALAKDATLAGTIFQEMGDSANAMNYFTQALAFWGALPSSGLQILTALDPLAAIARDQGAYRDAEAYCLRALRLREAALGPKHSDLIATLDSLAYALFGQQKYDEAESVYIRLLALWEATAGAEHPMVALTLDKMVEFYSAQKLYEKAAPLAERAQSMRTRTVIESFHRTGRVLVGEQKFAEALDQYQRVIKLGEAAKVSDESMDGILRAYALVLRQVGRIQEASAIENRLKEAIIRKADRDGTRRPKPTPIKP